ncbi:MAG: hypothetical protein OEX19_03335 [Gammaproteobacteria bacterium]|nr:hypothetical protein [Gammaproteobacteria bacterium]
MHDKHSITLGSGIVAGKPIIQVDGKNCEVLRIEHKLIDRLSGLLLIQKDLELSQAVFSRLIEEYKADRESILLQSYWFTGIISYGKCFAGAEGRKTKLEKRDHLKEAPEKLVSAHDNLIELRNQYVAHGGVSLNERADIWVALFPDPASKELAAIFETVSYSFSATVEEIELNLELVEMVKARVDVMLEKQWKKVEEGIGAIPIQSLYEAL